MTTTMMQDAATLADLGHEMRENSKRARATAARIDAFFEERHNCANLRAELSDVTAPMGWPESAQAFKDFAKRNQVSGVQAIMDWFEHFYLFRDGICQAYGKESFADRYVKGPVSDCCGSWLLRVDGSRVEAADLEARPF